jgi:hypothetical protein
MSVRDEIAKRYLTTRGQSRLAEPPPSCDKDGGGMLFADKHHHHHCEDRDHDRK